MLCLQGVFATSARRTAAAVLTPDTDVGLVYAMLQSLGELAYSIYQASSSSSSSSSSSCSTDGIVVIFNLPSQPAAAARKLSRQLSSSPGQFDVNLPLSSL